MVNVTFRDRTEDRGKKSAHIQIIVLMEKKGLILSASLKVNYPKKQSSIRVNLNAPSQCKLNFIPNLKIDKKNSKSLLIPKIIHTMCCVLIIVDLRYLQ